jgi:hypothetical protein
MCLLYDVDRDNLALFICPLCSRQTSRRACWKLEVVLAARPSPDLACPVFALGPFPVESSSVVIYSSVPYILTLSVLDGVDGIISLCTVTVQVHVVDLNILNMYGSQVISE